MTDAEFDRCMAVLHAVHPPHHWRHYATRKGITRCEWAVNVVRCGELATFDGDELTRLVIAAHQYRVRVAVVAHCRGYIRLQLNPRGDTGRTDQRHPGFERLAVARG